MYSQLRKRLGVCFDFSWSNQTIGEFPISLLGDDLWYYDYTHSPHGNGGTSGGMSGSEGYTGRPVDYPYQYQMVWDIKNNGTVAAGSIAARYPGRSWLIGNEPDNQGQSQTNPSTYATQFHKYYHYLKQKDPTCTVYWGGVTAMSPMRKRWLDQVLLEYQNTFGSAMPFDGIHTHGYLMPETGSFGIGQAYGLSGTADARTEQETWIHNGTIQHVNPTNFQADVIGFRTWMYNHGFQNKPLIISEYGDLGNFPQSNVENYMTQTLDWSLKATDIYVGNPLDEYRLIQSIAWFSVNFDFWGWVTLFNRQTKELTWQGKHYQKIYHDNFGDAMPLQESNNEITTESGNIFSFTENRLHG